MNSFGIEVAENKLWWSKPGFASFENLENNYAHYLVRNTTGTGWSYTDSEKVDRLYLGTVDNEFKVFNFDASNFKNTYELNTYQDFNFNSPFILFTGHGGGGTSIVVKFFRYLGVHFGDDCGNMDIRKPMESSSLRIWWEMLSNSHSIENLRNSFKSILGSYNYKKNQINAVKLVSIQPNNRALIMGNVLPNLKVISIVKKPSKHSPSTPEGERFSKKAIEDILLTQLVKLEGNKVFHLDWNRFFTDFKYCNKVINFMELKQYFSNQSELDSFTKKIGFDPDYLH